MTIQPPNRPAPAAAVAVPALAAEGRLMSLDALRGFDMFWIIGGEDVLRALADWSNSPVFRTIAYRNTEHPEWNGFTFYDLIFPLFMFIAGVALPYSLAAHRARGQGEWALHVRVIRRLILLLLLGAVYNGLLNFDFSIYWSENAHGHRTLVADFSHVRFASVLGRIGLGYFFAALIALHTRPRNQLLAAIGILLGYWAALSWVPVPGFQTGSLLPGQNVGDFIDRQLFPGRLYKVVRDPEGLFSTVPSVATVLLGVAAGHWLRTARAGEVKAAGLAAAGAACLALAYLWNPFFPFNKNLWSSSFVLLVGGWSLLLLALFYLLVDVWRIRGWSLFFVVIGVNAITIYVAGALVDFDALAKIVFTHRMHDVLRQNGGLALKWLLLFFLYKQRIFLRV